VKSHQLTSSRSVRDDNPAPCLLKGRIMLTVEEYLEIALGGNMNIGTLKLQAWYDIMTTYAKYYHKEMSDTESEGK